MNKHYFSRLLSLLLVLFISSCGGGGDSSDASPNSRKKGTVYGVVFDAPVSGSKVTVWEFKDGTVGRNLGSAVTDQLGNYEVEVTSASMPIYVEALGGAYRDPITSEVITVSNGKSLTMSSVANYQEGVTQPIMVTPLTHMVSGLTEFNVQAGVSASSAINDALERFESMYGFDVNEIKPIDITQGGQSSYAQSGHKYGALLTAYSSFSGDLINKYPSDESRTLYTSMHLSDIQYRDIRADGVLDGQEVDGNGVAKKMNFGQVDITADIYTNDLSQHTLIVVNNPDLNLSGTSAEDYQEFATQLNILGTSSDTSGVVAPRDMKPIDETPPEISREGGNVLAGADQITLAISDDVGVNDVTVSLELETLDGTIIKSCLESGGEPYCSLDKSEFKRGTRDTKVIVHVDTTELDRLGYADTDGLPYIQSAQLVASADDVLGNIHTDEQSAKIPFTWDNVAPVITMTSSPTINSSETTYILTGTIVDSESDIKSVVITQGDDVRSIQCYVAIGEVCSFNEAYDATQFGSSTRFLIEVTDSHDNKSGENFEVRKDNNLPTQTLSYPNASGAQMAFIKIDTNDNRGEVEYFDYSLNTFNESNIGTTSNHLKVDFNYARSGLLEVHDGIDFEDFNQSALAVLHANYIPYIKVVVQDEYDPDNGIIGSSAEDLELTVKYYVKSPTDNDFQYVDEKKSHTGSNVATHAIPHEKIEYNGEGRVSKVTYYIPFVKELLGTEYASVAERSQQKIVLTTKDRSENVSTPKTIYFRTTFDLPTFNVVTPFANANVELKGLNASGKFDSNPVSTCTTKLVEGTLDVATCQLRADLGSYRFLQVQLANPSSGKAYYYQWSNDSNQYREVDLSQSNFGAYFDYTNASDLYISELSAYHTGLFDYIWNSTADHTNSAALNYLEQVNNAIGSGVTNSFFKFDPITTRYATNEDLVSIPTFPGDEYQHRFLVESLVDMASNNVGYTSASYASAFYQDLVHDGKANGVGRSGDIYIGSNRITNDTYRKELASAYYERLVEQYGLSPQLALSFADIIATANPSIDVNGSTVSVFENAGGSIDTTPPDIRVLPNSEQQYGVFYQHPVTQQIFVAGQIDFTAQISDPSGVSNNPPPVFTPVWFVADSPVENDMILSFVPSGDSYNKSYAFNFNSLMYENIAELALKISASDNKQNAYPSDDPFISSFKVDNEFPNVLYKLPDGQAEDAYINITRQKSLNFVVKDVVGDDTSKRQIYFEPKVQGATPVLFEGDSVFAVNTPSSEFSDGQLVLQLCLTCGEGANKLDDGQWTAYVVAEDILGNRVDQTIEGAPAFTVNIDSTAFVVEEVVSSAVLGGNDIWEPTTLFSQDNGSPLGEVKVVYQQDGLPKVELKACGEENTDAACLLGTQPEIQVQLVADNIKNGSVKHFFYVTAIDTAIPVNTSNEGWYQFSVDIVGPEIKVKSPWASDFSGNGNGNVIGPGFRVNLQSVKDVSEVESLELFQKSEAGDLTAIKKQTFPNSQPQDDHFISVSASESAQIKTDPNANGRVSMVLKATDKKGFSSETELTQVRYDDQGPSLTLNLFNQESFYYAAGEGYPMVLNARDYDDSSIDAVTDDGVDKNSIRYWIYTGSSRPIGDGAVPTGDALRDIPFKATEEATLDVEAVDIRGNSGSEKFRVKVDNEAPKVEVTEVYSDDTPIEGNITENKDIKFSVVATDASGIKSVVAKYSYNDNQTETPLTVIEEGNDTWSTVLSKDMTKLDGSYDVNFTVEDNVVYPTARFAQNPNTTRISKTLKVLRQGVKLTVATPESFDTYNSAKTLQVTFADPGTEVKITQLECWIRPRIEEDVPQDTEQPYAIVESPPSSGPSCILHGTETIESGATLITRTTAENGATEVQKHSFNSIDVNGPLVQIAQDNDSATFQLTQTNVRRNEDDTSLRLNIPLFISDDLSGVEYTTGDVDGKPLLRVQDDFSFASAPVDCVDPSNDGSKVTCTYSANLLDIFGSVKKEQTVYLGNLADKVGNAPAEQKLITLVIPQGELNLEVTSPAVNADLNGDKLTIEFRYQVYQYSDVVEMQGLVGGSVYSSNSPGGGFRIPAPSQCSDDETWQCTYFEYDLQESEKNSQGLNVGVSIIDSWGKTATKKFAVNTDNTKPVIDSKQGAVRFDPTFATPGKKVTIYVDFNEEVSIPTGTLNRQNVSWLGAEGEYKSTWTGEVVLADVADSDTTVALTVSGFADKAGNVGDTNSTYSLPIQPTITIESFDNAVNNSNINSFTISGTSTRFTPLEDKLDIEFKDETGKTYTQTEVSVRSEGKWNSTINLSDKGLQDGDITITVRGTNSSRVDAASTGEDKFALSTSVPTIDRIEITTDGQLVEHNNETTVVLNFSEKVKQVSARLGNQTVNFAATEEAEVWSGVVTPTLNIGEVEQQLTVLAGYVTPSGNEGTEQSKVFKVKPLIETVDPVMGDDEITPNEADQVVIRGSARGFAVGDTLSVRVKSLVNVADDETRQATIKIDGKWVSEVIDMTGWQEGGIFVTVSGSNSEGVTADNETHDTGSVASQKPPVLEAVTFNPTHQVKNQFVNIEMVFDKPVSGVKAKLGSSEFLVSAVPDSDDQTWSGSVTMPELENADVATLTVTDYKDVYNNVGVANNLHSIPYSPEMTLNTVGNVYEDRADNLTISGTYKYIDKDTSNSNITVTSASNPASQLTKAITFNNDGTWSVTDLDVSDFPEGRVNLSFSGTVTVGNGVEVTGGYAPENESFTLTMLKPTVTSTTPVTIEAGKNGIARLEFSEQVAQGTVTISGQPTSLQNSNNVWTATTTGPLTGIELQESVDIVVSGFSSADTGNVMEAKTDAVDTELILGGSMSKATYNKVEAKTAEATGNAHGALQGASVTVQILNGDSTEVDKTTATVGSDGQWMTGDWDLSSLSGDYTMKATLDRGAESTDVQQAVTFNTGVPTLENAEFTTPTQEQHAKSGETVSVKLTFNTILNSVNATLGGEVVSLTKDADDGSIWSGTVSMPASTGATEATLTAGTFTDEHGNQGASNSSYALAFTPTLLVTNLPATVNAEQAKSMTISGSFERISDASGLKLKLASAVGSDETQAKSVVLDSGNKTWSVSGLDISTFPGGDVNLVFAGSVGLSNGVTASKGFIPTAESFTLDQSKPTITSVTKGIIEIDKKGVVSLVFSEEVTVGTATINGMTATPSGSGTNWALTTDSDLPKSMQLMETVEVVISDFTSVSSGNVMAEHTESVNTDLLVSAVMSRSTYNKDQAKTAQVTGSVHGVLEGASVTVQILNGDSTEVDKTTATVGSDGQWTTGDWDLSSLSGDYTMKATLDRGAESTDVQQAVTFNTGVPTLENAEFITPTQEQHAKSGETVSVKLTFNTIINSVNATLGGEVVNLTKDADDGSIWSGTVSMPASTGASEATLTVSSFTDEHGNQGASDSSYALAFTPTLLVTNLPSTVNAEQAKSMTVSGSYEHIVDASGLKLKLASEAGGDETQAKSVALDSGNNTWSVSGFDISTFPGGDVNLVFEGSVRLSTDVSASKGFIPDSESFTLDQSKPTVNSMTSSDIEFNKKGVVNLVFSEKVTAGTATINGIAATPTGNNKNWTLETVNPLPNTVQLMETVEVVISGFTSVSSGNVMAELTDSVSTYLFVDAAMSQSTYNKEQAQTAQVTGSAQGVQEGASVTVQILSGDSTIAADTTATVDSDGQWTTGDWDLSGLSGEHSLNVILTRSDGTVKAEQSQILFNTEQPALDTGPELTPSPVVSNGESTVSVGFTTNVASIESTTINGLAVTWETTGPAKQWTGTVSLADIYDSQVLLILGTATDEFGNKLIDSTGYVYNVQPELTIDTVTTSPETLSATILTGTALGFEQNASLSIRLNNGTDDVMTDIPATVGENGTWQTSGVDLSSLPTGTYTVVVSGTNNQNIAAVDAMYSGLDL
ncbi:tandem large repeat [Vibrio maritimus]|uniref:tandem large repeat n=1 Tax=Vibrio maritimus TaxID=990268 RepID=UPI004067F432